MRAQRKKTPSCPALRKKYPHCGVLLTLGAHGARCMDPGERVTRCGSYRVRAVDTTAAGDTFTGYFLYGMLHGLSIPDTLRLATTGLRALRGQAGRGGFRAGKSGGGARRLPGSASGRCLSAQEEMQ